MGNLVARALAKIGGIGLAYQFDLLCLFGSTAAIAATRVSCALT